MSSGFKLVFKAPNAATEEAIRAVLEKNGRKVLSVMLVRDRETGQSRGQGTVEIDTQESAIQAIAECNGMSLAGGQLLLAEPSVPPSGGARGSAPSFVDPTRERGRGPNPGNGGRSGR